MLENALKNKQEHFDYKDMTSQLQQTLSGLQLKIRDKKLPVIIIFEGWSASGKGRPVCPALMLRDTMQIGKMMETEAGKI